MIRFFLTSHKAATTWAMSILHPLCEELGQECSFYPEGSGKRCRAARPWSDRGNQVIAIGNARPEDLQATTSDRRVVQLMRDPRDVLCSGYFSHRNSHPTDNWPELVEHRARLRGATEEEGLILELDFSDRFLRPFYDWAAEWSCKNFKLVRFEDLIADPYGGWAGIFSHLELLRESGQADLYDLLFAPRAVWNKACARGWLPQPFQLRGQKLPASQVLGRVYRERFEKKTGGRSQGQSDQNSHFRSGVSGGWRRTMTPRVAEAFEEHFPELVVTTGYDSPGWEERFACNKVIEAKTPLTFDQQ